MLTGVLLLSKALTPANALRQLTESLSAQEKAFMIWQPAQLRSVFCCTKC